MPLADPPLVGAHVFVGGGLRRTALPYAERIGAEVVQLFLANPRGWRPPAPDLAGDEAFAADCTDRSLPVFVHAPYLVNLGSPTDLTRERSRDAIAHSLQRGRRVGARGVVVHAGSAVDPEHRPNALRHVRELLLPLLDGLDGADPDVLVEPTAGGGQPLAATVEDVAAYVDLLDGHPRLGICLDTCHALAAGHDVRTAAGMRATLDLVARETGRGRLRLVHANDSRDDLGSGRDRHANLGTGTITTDAFGALVTHPVVHGVPVLVETPGDEAAHRDDIATLRRLRDG